MSVHTVTDNIIIMSPTYSYEYLVDVTVSSFVTVSMYHEMQNCSSVFSAALCILTAVRSQTVLSLCLKFSCWLPCMDDGSV